jgi:hypothetical protein
MISEFFNVLCNTGIRTAPASTPPDAPRNLSIKKTLAAPPCSFCLNNPCNGPADAKQKGCH